MASFTYLGIVNPWPQCFDMVTPLFLTRKICPNIPKLFSRCFVFVSSETGNTYQLVLESGRRPVLAVLNDSLTPRQLFKSLNDLHPKLVRVNLRYLETKQSGVSAPCSRQVHPQPCKPGCWGTRTENARSLERMDVTPSCWGGCGSQLVPIPWEGMSEAHEQRCTNTHVLPSCTTMTQVSEPTLHARG
jgi:hypothetical protein